MTRRETYERIARPDRAGYRDAYERRVAVLRPHAQLIDGVARALVGLVAVSFTGLVALLAVAGEWIALVRVAAVCAATFALVTGLRAGIDAPRPYEPPCALDPLVPKGTRGRSFPSRHVASAAIIACAFTWAVAQHTASGPAVLPALPAIVAAVSFAVAAAVAVLRVVQGQHFPRDVAAGFALACLCGAVGFVLIP